MADKCLLCEIPREPDSEFCTLHSMALRNLQGAYSSWNKACDGKLSLEQYYIEVSALPETGRAVREAIQYLRGRGAVT
jgi:hypothetical protein